MIDNTQVDDSITANPATEQVSAATDQAEPVSQHQDPATSGDTTNGSAQVQPASDQTRERSLTSQTGPTSAEQPANDWEKKYHEMSKGFGRMRNEYGSMRQKLEQFEQQFNGVDPNTVRAWKQQQEVAQQAKLNPWHQKHPERPAFLQTYSEYQRLLRGWQRAEAPEAKAAFAAEIEQIPAEARQKIAAYEQHKRSITDRIASEMDGFESLDEMIASKAASIVQQERMKAEAETKVNAWFDAAENKPIVDYTAPALQKALQDGVPLNYAQKMAEMAYKLDAYESRLANTDQVAAAAQARTQAAKANASITRDTTATNGRRVDPVQVAKERGITDLQSSAYVHLLSELSSKNLI